MKTTFGAVLLSTLLLPGFAAGQTRVEVRGYGPPPGPQYQAGPYEELPAPGVRVRVEQNGPYRAAPAPAPVYRREVYYYGHYGPYWSSPRYEVRTLPPQPYVRYWTRHGDDDDYEDWLEDRRERWEDRREYERARSYGWRGRFRDDDDDDDDDDWDDD